jgi:hypothetical protein
MLTMSEVLKYVADSNGEEFTVRFFKRGTKTLREMVCKTGETSKLKGGERAYNPIEHLLVYVFEINVGYKCFPLDGLQEIKIKDEWHKVAPPEPYIKYDDILALRGTQISESFRSMIPFLKRMKCDIDENGFIHNVPTREEWQKL